MAISYGIKLGPWGNEASQNWSFVLAEGQAIKEIKIRHGYIVDALTFVLVDGAGKLTTTDRFGGSGGDESRIELDAFKEYITQISGTHGDYYGSRHVTSIKIHTNLKPDGYGPFGQNSGVSNSMSFSTPSFNGLSIVGLHGGSGGKYLESVGIFVNQKSYITKLGPWGNEASQNWSFVLAEGQAIKEIKIRHGFIVDALTFVLVDGAGNLITTDRFGGSRGSESRIELDAFKEYITQISGTHGVYEGGDHITSIKIHTNLKPDGYGPFGQNRGVTNSMLFSTPSLNGPSIVGFHGGYGRNYLDSVGIIVRQPLFPAVKIGPWGAEGPINWSFLIDTPDKISSIVVVSGAVIDSIQFIVVNKGGDRIGVLNFGGEGGPNVNQVHLDESEYLTNVSGTHGLWHGTRYVTSLTFHTNKSTYGPFGYNFDRPGGGATNNVAFNVPMNGGTVTGFFGRQGEFINSIGFYATPI